MWIFSYRARTFKGQKGDFGSAVIEVSGITEEQLAANNTT